MESEYVTAIIPETCSMEGNAGNSAHIHQWLNQAFSDSRAHCGSIYNYL